MHNLVLSPIDPERLMSNIADRVTASVLAALSKKTNAEPEMSMSGAGGKRIATAAATAKYLKRPLSAIYQMQHRGIISGIKMPGSRKLYFDLDQIDNAFQAVNAKA
jgi:hypothetical protein